MTTPLKQLRKEAQPDDSLLEMANVNAWNAALDAVAPLIEKARQEGFEEARKKYEVK